jgi:hypothetical protein
VLSTNPMAQPDA